MGLADVLVLTAVAALLALAVRSLVRGSRGGCAGCGSVGSCSAHATGGPCPAASDMLRRAEERLDDARNG